MQKRILRNSTILTAVILLVGTLALPVGAKDKKQVTRPFKAVSVMTVHYTPISLTTAIVHNEEDGNGTYLGLFHNVGDGLTDFLKGTMTGSGTVTAANGDTAHWVFTPESGFTVDGGTGRFENASGYLLWTVVSQSDPVPDPDGLGGFTVTMLATYEGEVTF